MSKKKCNTHFATTKSKKTIKTQGESPQANMYALKNALQKEINKYARKSVRFTHSMPAEKTWPGANREARLKKFPKHFFLNKKNHNLIGGVTSTVS